MEEKDGERRENRKAEEKRKKKMSEIDETEKLAREELTTARDWQLPSRFRLYRLLYAYKKIDLPTNGIEL